MVQGDVVIAGDFAHNGLGKRREQYTADAAQHGANQHGGHMAEAAQAHAEQDAGHCHIDGRLAVQKDIFPFGETGDNQVHHKDTRIYKSDVAANGIVLHGNSQHSLNGSDRTLDAQPC